MGLSLSLRGIILSLFRGLYASVLLGFGGILPPRPPRPIRGVAGAFSPLFCWDAGASGASTAVLIGTMGCNVSFVTSANPRFRTEGHPLLVSTATTGARHAGIPLPEVLTFGFTVIVDRHRIEDAHRCVTVAVSKTAKPIRLRN